MSQRWNVSPNSCFLSQQNAFLRRESSRGDGTVPSRPNRKGSVGRGGVLLVDEDTDLLDTIFQNGRQVNPRLKPSRNGPKGSQKGKPELSSKNMEENITTEKKKDSNGRTSSLFPGKPSDDVIDLDIGGSPKKPSLGFPAPPKIPSDPRSTTDSSKVTTTISPLPDVKGSSRTTQSSIQFDRRHEHKGRLPEKGRPATVAIVSRDGNLVLGSDGKMYRLQRGPPGRMGPPGLEVSGLLVFSLLSLLDLL